MKLSERLDKALAKRDLVGISPTPKQQPKPQPQPKPKIQPKEVAVNYQSVQEGFQNLHRHDTDEDGIGSFTARDLGIDKIQLPMAVGEFVVEEIQRTKTGIIQVQFRKDE